MLNKCFSYIPLMSCLNFTILLFFISVVGIIWNKHSLLNMLLCIELMFFSIILQFLFISFFSFNNLGKLYSLLIITSTACETAIGLSLIIILYRSSSCVSFNSLTNLRG